MSVSGISSSGFFNSQNASVQNQQQWQQEFEKLTQELQSGTFASPGAGVQTTALAQSITVQPGAKGSATPTTQSENSESLLLRAPHGTPEHGLHWRHPHHLQVGAGNGSEDGSTPPETANLDHVSNPQQAFSLWQKNLQQVALNADLLTAQNADWQPVSLSA